jgi:hypothetical protein
MGNKNCSLFNSVKKTKGEYGGFGGGDIFT